MRMAVDHLMSVNSPATPNTGTLAFLLYHKCGLHTAKFLPSSTYKIRLCLHSLIFYDLYRKRKSAIAFSLFILRLDKHFLECNL